MTSFLDKNGLQRYHNDIKEGLNEVRIQNMEPETGKLWFDGNFVIDPSDFDAEKQEVVVSDTPPETDHHHKLWIQPNNIQEKTFIELALNTLYPVGCYFETSDVNFNPNNSFIGTWVEDTQGQTLVSRNNGTFGTVGDSIGEETHKLTINEMPSHTHNIKWGNYTPSFNSGGSNLRIPWTDFKGNNEFINADDTGGNQPHNNIQPSKVIIRWHRIS